MLNRAVMESSVASSLSGTWYNQRRSVMKINASMDGSLSGEYCSGVDNADGYYVLSGRFDAKPLPGQNPTLGWTVNWNNDKHGNSISTASWTGHYFATPEPQILTGWMLAISSVPTNPRNKTGSDWFLRTGRPSPRCDESWW